ncbi:MAG: TRAP transporter large permease [Moorellales bacterium]
MGPIEIGIVGLCAFLVLLLLGMPIGAAMASVGFIGLLCLTSPGAALTKLAGVAFDTVSSYDLAVMPLFVFMANLIFCTGMGKDLFGLAYKWLGRLPGGVALASIAGCAGFAAVSSSSIATAATMGSVALPEMKRLKYDPALATGVIASAGTMGVLIPPSNVLIIYGILTGTSIGKLFLAGVIPGILEALFYMAVVFLLCRLNPRLGPPGVGFTIKEKLLAFKNCGEIAVLMLLLMGGLLLGWFTPTEAGAVGAVAAVLISVARKRLTWPALKEACLTTMRTTGMVYGVIIGAFFFNYFLALTRIPFVLTDFVGGLPISPLGIAAMMMLIYFGLGCILDTAAMTVLTIPIFFPIIASLGLNPIWFGILVVRAAEVGMITPPMGMNVFIISGVARDVPMQTIFKGILPFLLADFVHVALILLVPSLTLFLPAISAQ